MPKFLCWEMLDVFSSFYAIIYAYCNLNQHVMIKYSLLLLLSFKN
jgi:hypothetical protein